MSAVWLCIPSRRDIPQSTLPAWRELGYKIAIAREPDLPPTCADITIPLEHYIGWSHATNLLIHHVMREDPDAWWFVCGGDDTMPDPNNSPGKIFAECCEHFGLVGAKKHGFKTEGLAPYLSTFGVMQPTGDDWSDSQGKMIERIAGSPWIGRAFAKRMYQGRGPLYPDFTYSFADEHLQCVATQLGVFWQRPDLCHEHRHIARNRPNWQQTQPEWTKKLYGSEQWKFNQTLFRKLRDAGFKEAYEQLD